MLPLPSERIVTKRVARLAPNPYGPAEFWLLTNGQVWMTEPNGKDPWAFNRNTLAEFIEYAENHELRQIILNPEYTRERPVIPVQMRLF